ncbi:MAG: hypothetical protein R2734_15880 [Nocardioides sp.]
MNKRSVLLLVATVVALLGTMLVFLYVRGADNRASAKYDTVKVLRATEVIEAGETIESVSGAGKLALQDVPQNQPPAGRADRHQVPGRPGGDDPDLPGRADHRRQVRWPSGVRLAGDPGGHAGHLGDAYRPGPGRRLRQPRVRDRDLPRSVPQRRLPADVQCGTTPSRCTRRTPTASRSTPTGRCCFSSGSRSWAWGRRRPPRR